MPAGQVLEQDTWRTAVLGDGRITAVSELELGESTYVSRFGNVRGMDLDEEALSTLLRRARPHPLAAAIPSTLRPWLLPASWDQARLWSVARPPTTSRVTDLRWHYELPWWRGNDNRWFSVSPRDYLENPAEFPEHESRISSSDLAFPLHGVRRRGRIQLLDGIHRLVRADGLGRLNVDVILLSLEDIAGIINVS